LPGHGAPANEKTTAPFLKAFACGGVLFAVFFIFLLASKAPNFTYRITYTSLSCFIPAVITGFWCFKDKQRWSWGRIIGTYVGVAVGLAVLRMQGKTQ